MPGLNNSSSLGSGVTIIGPETGSPTTVLFFSFLSSPCAGKDAATPADNNPVPRIEFLKKSLLFEYMIIQFWKYFVHSYNRPSDLSTQS